MVVADDVNVQQYEQLVDIASELSSNGTEIGVMRGGARWCNSEGISGSTRSLD
jgi:3-deoxy-D-arabino-heptulosonate 7-phosphate (DAHP) synthase